MAVSANDLVARTDELGTAGKVTRNTLQATKSKFCSFAIHGARMRGREGTAAALGVRTPSEVRNADAIGEIQWSYLLDVFNMFPPEDLATKTVRFYDEEYAGTSVCRDVRRTLDRPDGKSEKMYNIARTTPGRQAQAT